MYYIGMAAMEMDIDYYYRPSIFIFSILIAIIVSYVALYIFTSMQRFMGNFYVKVITSLLMGMAVASMHYAGMEAVVFYAEGTVLPAAQHEHHMDLHTLILAVTLGIGVILGFSGLSSLFDRYVDFRLNHIDALTGLPNRRQFEKVLNVSSPASIGVLHVYMDWKNGIAGMDRNSGRSD